MFCLDPTHVMGLYPELLPSDYKKQLQYPNPVPVLSPAELEKAHLALIDYLTQVGILMVDIWLLVVAVCVNDVNKLYLTISWTFLIHVG